LAEETIKIRFEVDTTELAKAVDLLKQLLGPLQQFQSLSQKFTTSTNQMGTSVGTATPQIDSFRNSIERLGAKYGLAGKELENFVDIVDTLATSKVGPEVKKEAFKMLSEMTGQSIKKIRSTVKVVAEDFKKFERIEIFSNLPSQLEQSSTYISQFIPAIREIGSSFGLSGRILDTFVKDIVKLSSIKLPKSEFEEYAYLISKSTGISVENIIEMANSFRSASKQMATNMKAQQREARRLARELDPVAQGYRKVRREAHAFRAVSGTVMTHLRRLAYQFYWLGIGIMFVSMSFARAQSRAVQTQSKILSLARAHAALIEAQRNAREVMLEYGRGSEEHRQALGRLIEAKYALRLATEQTRNALIQERLANVQLYTGMIPAIINAFMMGTYLFDLYRAHLLATQGALQHYFANNLLFGSQKNAIIGSSVQQKMTQYLGDTQMIAGAKTGFLATMQRLLSIESLKAAWATGLLKSILIGGIFAVATFAISWGLAMNAMAEANRQMEEMMGSVEDLGEAIAGQGPLIDQMIGGSGGILGIAEASVEAKREIKDLYSITDQNIEPIEVEVKVKKENIELDIEEEKTQYIIRKYIEEEKEIKSLTQLVLRKYIDEEPSIENRIQSITRIFSGEEPIIFDKEQIILRKFVGEEPGIEDKIQIINRVFHGVEPLLSPAIQNVRRVLVKDIPEVDTVTQEVSRYLTKDIPELESKEQIIERKVIGEISSILPVTQEVDRVITKEIEEPPETIQKVSRVLTRRLPVPELMTQTVRREVEEIPDVLPTIQEVNRILIQDVPEITPVTQEVRRRLVEDISGIDHLRREVAVSQQNITNNINVVIPGITISKEVDLETLQNAIIVSISRGLEQEGLIR